MPTDNTQLQIGETVSSLQGFTLNITEDVTTVYVNNMAIPNQDSTEISFTPYNTITATNVADALKQLADQDFRSDTAPTGASVGEGDTWYDTDDDQLKVYRETSSGVFQWVPIIVGAAGGDSDTLDAGTF